MRSNFVLVFLLPQVKVYFLDASSKTLLLDDEETFDDLIVQCLSKMDVPHPEDAARSAHDT